MPDDATIKALGAAIELLTRQVADLPVALVRHMGKAPQEIEEDMMRGGRIAFSALGRDHALGSVDEQGLDEAL